MTSNETLAVLASALAEAEKDYAQWQRLTSAERRVKQLTQEHAKAKADHDREQATKTKAAEAARFNGLSDIQVTRGGRPDENVVRASFAISYLKETQDPNTGQSRPQRQIIQGFKTLDPTVFAFLIEKHPDRIPPDIMALAPGDPLAAFGAYFTALRRGYTTAPKASA